MATSARASDGEGAFFAPDNADYPLAVDHPAGVEAGKHVQLGLGVGALVYRLADQLLGFRQCTTIDLLQKRMLVGEIVVDDRLGPGQPRGNHVHRAIVIAVLEECVTGCPHDQVLAI